MLQPPQTADYSPAEDTPSSCPPPETAAEPVPTSAPVVPHRRSTRSHKTPSHLQDYVCSHFHANWCNLTFLSPTSFAALTALEEFPEPVSYEQAAKHPGWVQAMNKEIQALQINNTWEEVSLPPHKKAISCKWVYKTKLKSDGTLERLKARLVIRGFTQEYGVDYQEVFSPVVKMSTIRTIMALAASKG